MYHVQILKDIKINVCELWSKPCLHFLVLIIVIRINKINIIEQKSKD